MDSVFHVAFSQATTCDGGIQHSVKSKQNLKSFEKLSSTEWDSWKFVFIVI